MTSMKQDTELRQVNLLSELNVGDGEGQINSRQAELGPARDIYQQPLTPPVSPVGPEPATTTTTTTKPAAVLNRQGAATKQEASLYFVREGNVRLVSECSCDEDNDDYDRVVDAGGHFGEDMFVSRCSKRRNTTVTVPYTVTALTDTVCGVLTLKDCKTVFDTDILANANVSGEEEIDTPHQRKVEEDLTLKDSMTVFDTDFLANENVPGHEVIVTPQKGTRTGVELEEPTEAETVTEDSSSSLVLIQEAKPEFSVPLHDLKRHKILGEGMFGQVWLVSQQNQETDYDRTQKPFALKIQSKYDLASEGQIENVVREKEIISKLHHPFISNLVATYQNETFVYMLLDMVQGGELFSIMHQNDDEDGNSCGLPESQAKFYAFCIADALAYMHQGKIVYRDLKPENVMIDRRGYPVLIDFGYAKYVSEKTYTMCGTPAYLPPEVVMTEGHDCSADHWSLGILIYEMIAGENPFYFDGIDQMTLFECIVEEVFKPLSNVSPDVNDLVSKLLTKDPAERLGSLTGGEDDILRHRWFQTHDLLAMRRREVVAPWIPKLKDAFDTGCFDDWDHLEDKTSLKYPDLEPRDAALFEGF